MFSIVSSCSSVDNLEGLEVYLWDYRDCANCIPKEIFIEKNKIYSNDRGNLSSRFLGKNELDSLSNIISGINTNKIDSTYYNHLAHYDFIADFSIKSSTIVFTTSIYDSIFPKEIYNARNYILEIADRKGLEIVSNKPAQELKDLWIHRLVKNNGDTLLTSRESFFKVQKILFHTNEDDWVETNAIGNIDYKIYFRNVGELKSEIESIGITNDNELFYKLKYNKKYFVTPFNYRITDYPKYNPNLPTPSSL